ncbi:hypothetical protein AB4212_23290 [Streptomyces sp. 2MCAF27]
MKRALFGPRIATPERQPIPAAPPPPATTPDLTPRPVSYAEQTRFRLPRVPVEWAIPLMGTLDPAPPYIPSFTREQAAMER